MGTNRLNVHKPSARNWDAQTAAALLRNDQGGVSAHAEYRREDYVFARTQSPAMRLLEWEDRVKPLKHWGSDAVANLAWTIFA